MVVDVEKGSRVPLLNSIGSLRRGARLLAALAEVYKINMITGKSGLQIRISVNLNFELLNFKFELANLRTFLKLRTSPYRFPPIFKKCCILEKSRKNLANIWPKFSKNSAKFGKICKNLQKNSKIFSNF